MTTSLFDRAEELRGELQDALAVAVLPAVTKATYRELIQQAGNDVAKLDALLLRLRARRGEAR